MPLPRSLCRRQSAGGVRGCHQLSGYRSRCLRSNHCRASDWRESRNPPRLGGGCGGVFGTHEATTSPTGVVNLSIGNGTEPSGAFSDIDWGASTYFLKLSMDTEGGKDYKEVATTQIMPVPYALYAKEAGNVKGSNETPKFLINSSESGTIYDMMANKEVPFSVYQTEEYGFFSFFCSILYLDGNNQELNIEIEGLPTGSSFTNDKDYSGASVSTMQGRYFEMAYRIPVSAGTTHNVKLVVKDKDNQTIQEYPFTLILEKRS